MTVNKKLFGWALKTQSRSDPNLRIHPNYPNSVLSHSEHSDQIRSIRIGARGFTLIELLVVISIIGILTTLVTVSSTAARSQARDAQRKSDLQNVAATLEIYRTTNKHYPDIQSRAGSWALLKAALYPTYLSQWPEDPKNNATYSYTYVSNAPTLAAVGSMYALDAVLENDSEKITTPEASELTNDTLNAFVSGTFKSNASASVGKIKQRVAGR